MSVDPTAPARAVAPESTRPEDGVADGFDDPAARPDREPPAPTRRERRRAKREARWNRPPPPMDWRWWVGWTGRILIALGLLVFGFVAYQLWGTAIENAMAQNALEDEFEEMLAEVADPAAISESPGSGNAQDAAETTASDTAERTAESEDPEGSPRPSTAEPAAGSESADDATAATADDSDEPPADPDGAAAGDSPTPVPVDEQDIPDFEEGDALAQLVIPRIGVDHIVVAGVSWGDLKKGPGHYPDTPLPGQLGNSAIAGHRTTYGQPFYDIQDLSVGDEIFVNTVWGEFEYRVTGSEIVNPSDYEVVATTDPGVANLTLTSCHPRWTAQQRIVVYSELVDDRSAPVGEPVYDYGRDETPPVAAAENEPASPPSDEPAPEGSTAANTQAVADAFADGWFSDPGAPPHVALWAAVLAAIGAVFYLVSRAAKRWWVGFAVATLPFLVALYFFYQNVNRLLPPNL